jgi:hypothetical protein
MRTSEISLSLYYLHFKGNFGETFLFQPGRAAILHQRRLFARSNTHLGVHAGLGRLLGVLLRRLLLVQRAQWSLLPLPDHQRLRPHGLHLTRHPQVSQKNVVLNYTFYVFLALLRRKQS